MTKGKRCSADKKGPKRKPYGLKGWDYCNCDTHMVDVVSKGAIRQKLKREIEKEEAERLQRLVRQERFRRKLSF